jgi:serine/threonine protein phosphatase PrpC
MTDNFFGATDLGRQRQNNEDAFIAQQTADGRYIIACVIDGVGGYSGGEVAAAIAHETIIQRLNNLGGEVIPGITDALITANHKIWEARQANAGHSSMACVVTLALVDIETNQFYYAHLGDTRLYLFRDGSLVKISHDHSFVGFLEDSGRLSESDAMNHPKRNEIDKALGFKSDAAAADYIETGQSPFLPGDMLLLCSDGLTDLVDKAAMTKIMARHDSLEVIGRELIGAANYGGGRDNITVVVVKNNKLKQQHTATKPTESAKIFTSGTVKKNDEPEKRTVVIERKPVKTYKGISILLLILVLGFAAVCAWQFINKQQATNTDTPRKDTVAKPKVPNPQEVKLQSIISQSKGRMLILTDSIFKGPVVIDQPILIDRDSLHIKAKGNIVLQSDSGFKKPAFIVSPKVKIVVLDSLTFQNFAVAISGHDQAVQLKNTRFINCDVPIENDYKLSPGKYISGNAGTAAFKTDSPSKKK